MGTCTRPSSGSACELGGDQTTHHLGPTPPIWLKFGCGAACWIRAAQIRRVYLAKLLFTPRFLSRRARFVTAPPWPSQLGVTVRTPPRRIPSLTPRFFCRFIRFPPVCVSYFSLVRFLCSKPTFYIFLTVKLCSTRGGVGQWGLSGNGRFEGPPPRIWTRF